LIFSLFGFGQVLDQSVIVRNQVISSRKKLAMPIPMVLFVIPTRHKCGGFTTQDEEEF